MAPAVSRVLAFAVLVAACSSPATPAGHDAALPVVAPPDSAGPEASAPVPVVAAPDSGVDVAVPAPDAAGADAGADLAAPAGAVVWDIDNVKSIGGHPVTVLGAPMVIDVPGGKALQFDGTKDALYIENHPLAGLAQFTVEVVFRPDPGGAPAQRYFHMDAGDAGRVLFETRLPGGGQWVQDVFVESRSGNVALYDARATHPLGAWYHIAAVVDGKTMHHYVNGVEESRVMLGFTPHPPGRTSIGVRITRNYFFKGAIRVARFTPRVLTPAEFLKVE
jgi:hypothetical protein